MGCDVHMFLERKLEDESNEWASADIWDKNDLFIDYPDSSFPEYKVKAVNRLFNRSSYILYAILASVRNDDNKIIPIAKPRGLPSNVSEMVRRQEEFWGVEGHSHSWLTLDEIINYDWTQTFTDYHGEIRCYKDYFEIFINKIHTINKTGTFRTVFWFDN